MIAIRTVILFSIAISVTGQPLDNLFRNRNRTGGIFNGGGLLGGNNGNSTGGGFRNRTTVRDRFKNVRVAIAQGIKAVANNTLGIELPEWFGNPDIGVVGSGICGIAVGVASNVDVVSSFLGDGEIDCDCGVDDGFANLKCEITSSICVEDGICGQVDLTGKYQTRGQPRKFLTTGCFTLDTDEVDGSYKDFCVQIDHSGIPEEVSNPEFFFYDCDMWAIGENGPEKCNFCNSCNDNSGIQYDCSNVDLDNSDQNFTIPSDPDECMVLLGGSTFSVNGNSFPIPQFTQS